MRYVEFDVEQIWKTFPEYSDPTKTYTAFKNAILVHYPDASGDYVYSLRDMDLLIGERQRLGISTTTDLSDYHLKFISITSWLIEKKQLGSLEQERGYLRAFQPHLLAAVNNRLQMKFPDRHPNIPHTVKDVDRSGYCVGTDAAILAYYLRILNTKCTLLIRLQPMFNISLES